MYISNLIIVSALTAFAAGQTTTTFSSSSTASACAALPVLDQCIASTTAIVQACASTDYNCLCQKYTDLITCFNVCPNDSRLSAAQTQQSTYCSDASVYTSSTSSVISRDASATTTTSNSGSATGTSTGSATTDNGAVRVSSASSSAASATATEKSGAHKVAGAGSVALGFAGLIALL